MGGVGGGVEVEELAEDEAGSGSGVLRQGQGFDLGEDGVVGVVGEDEGGLLGGGDLGGLGGCGVFSLEEALVGVFAQLPEDDGHDGGGGKQQGDEDGLMAGGDHGW
jgi:hypothetical protein